MFRRLINFGVLLVTSILLLACVERAQPIYNASSVTIPEKLRFAPISDVETAIIRGGNREGWLMETISPGKIKGTLNIRTHQAVVDIVYTTTDYSITYAASKNLLHSNSGIHKNYNVWVRELETSINSSLDRIGSARTIQEAPVINSDETAWRAIENSQDPKQFVLFLENYGDSAYAPAAVKRLSGFIDSGAISRLANPFGEWRVTATYNAIRGSSSWCVKQRSWQFVQHISSTPVKRTVWHRETALYLESDYVEKNILLKIIVPDGGSDWKWDKPLSLNSEREVFNAVAIAGGGSYGNCLGRLNVIMTKMS
ncbi:MAG: hypothetical protein NXI13_00535 [Proteobacteria bacterium]|nr:hypothetical protein [Pseudomonadota bacterium]